MDLMVVSLVSWIVMMAGWPEGVVNSVYRLGRVVLREEAFQVMN